MKRITTLLLISLLLFSCIKENGSDNPPITNSVQIMTLNEGNYMASNASMTGYIPDTKTTIPDYFNVLAGESVTMGDSPTCIYQYGKTCFISMSGSGKIYAFDPEEGKLLYTIKGLSSPRYMFASSNKMWVTDLYNSNLTQIDLSTKSIVRQVDIESSAEMLIQFGNYLYANLWNYNKKIIKIDPSTGTTIESLEVGIQPCSMAIDRKNGKLWVYCDGGGWDGNPIGYEDPSIFRIDISSGKMKIEKRFNLPRSGGFSFKIAIGTDFYGNPIDNYIYFINSDLYRMDRDSETLPSKPFVESKGENFYALAVNENKEIYLSDAVDYVSDGLCYRYNTEGKLLDTFSTGISPGYIFYYTSYE